MQPLQQLAGNDTEKRSQTDWSETWKLWAERTAAKCDSESWGNTEGADHRKIQVVYQGGKCFHRCSSGSESRSSRRLQCQWALSGHFIRYTLVRLANLSLALLTSGRRVWLTRSDLWPLTSSTQHFFVFWRRPWWMDRCDVADPQQFVKHSNQLVRHQQLCSSRSKSPSVFALFVFTATVWTPLGCCHVTGWVLDKRMNASSKLTGECEAAQGGY